MPAPIVARAVIFDLDEALIDSRRAWRYAVEESISAVCGRRVDASGLVSEYRRRPWAHALSVLVDEPDEQRECADLCAEIYGRSAMKRLLVHEGVGMGLDRLRSGRVEIGAISREPHGRARRQIESTGLDRFLSVLSATPGGQWGPRERLTETITFLERRPEECVFVGIDRDSLAVATVAGFRCLLARWATDGEPLGFEELAVPGDLCFVSTGDRVG